MISNARLSELDTPMNFGDTLGITTFREIFKTNPVVEKHKCIKEYSDHRVCLAYIKYKTPKVLYTITLKDGSMYDVKAKTWHELDIPVGETTF